MKKYVENVFDYARQHYNEGWDVVVETMTPDDMRKMIKGAESYDEAVDIVRKFVHVYMEHRDDIRGGRF